MEIQFIVALVATAHLTFTLVLTEVLVMSYQLVLVVDADQGISRCELLIELLLRRHDNVASASSLFALRSGACHTRRLQ